LSEIVKREETTEIVGMYYRKTIRITLSAGIISIKSFTFDPVMAVIKKNEPIKTEFVEEKEESKDAK